MNSSRQLASDPPNTGPVRHSRLALAALLLSIFAFIPPFGIAAVVLGHVASHRIAGSQGHLNGQATSRAAIIIGYLQMVLVIAAVVFGWHELQRTAGDFRRDALVQRVFRQADARQPLDETSAREEENTARTLLIQIVAMQDQYHRSKGQGYLCSIGELIQAGLEGFGIPHRGTNSHRRCGKRS